MDQNIQESILASIVNSLRDFNASNELILESLDSYNYTLASNDSELLVSETPLLLDSIRIAIDNLTAVVKDISQGVTLNTSEIIEASDDRDRAEREDLLRSRSETDDSSSGVSFAAVKPQSIFEGILASGLFLAGFIKGFVGSIVKKLTSAFNGATGAIRDSRLANFIKSTFATIIKTIKESKIINFIQSTFATISNTVKSVSSVILKPFTSAIKNIKDAFALISKGISFFSSGQGFLKKFINQIGRISTLITGWFKIGVKFGKAFATLGRLLAWPLTLVLGIVGAVTGAIKGYKEDGIIGAIKGGIVGLVDSVVTGLLDLIKDGVSWIANKLGFEGVSTFLDSFSFTDIFKEFTDKFFDFVSNVFTFDFTANADILKDLGSWLASALGFDDISKFLDSFSVEDVVSNFNKSILRSILPDPNGDTSLTSISGWVRKAIPDSVYEYAGISPKESTSKEIKAKRAGYNTFEEYEKSGWKWKGDSSSMITPKPSTSGATLNSAGSTSANVTVINNMNSGGNVTNMSSSNVNNTMNGASQPILAGSAMGFAMI